MIKRHFLESKDHLIDRLYNLSKQQKEEIKVFFKKHPNYENKIDWNNRDLKYKDFKPILDLENKSKAVAKKTGIAGLAEGTDYKFFSSNEYYNIYQPLTHWGSKILASAKVGLQETVGKWCISMNSDNYWNSYLSRGKVFFFMIATKEEIPHRFQKIAICYDAARRYNPTLIFDADDHEFTSEDFNWVMAKTGIRKINWEDFHKGKLFSWADFLNDICDQIQQSHPKDMGAEFRAKAEAERARRRANQMADNLSTMTDGDAGTFGWNYTFRSPRPENLYVKVLMLLDGNKQMRKADILSQLYVNEDIPSQTVGRWERDENGRYHRVDHKPHTRDERAQYFHQTHNTYDGPRSNAHGYESNLFTAMRNAGLLTYNRNRTWSWGQNAEPYVQYWNLRQRFEQYKRQHPEKEY